MKYLASIFFLASFSLSAAFEDYSSIQSFLLDSDPRNEKVFVLLKDKRIFSTDYHPSNFKRTRDEYPQYPSAMRKKGIEGYAEIGFTVNEDGSTSNHRIINSKPRDYFDKNSLIEAKGLRYVKDNNIDFINTKGSSHKHRFTFNLAKDSRKVPSGIFRCMELIYQDRFLAAKNCSEKRTSIHSGYTIPLAMSLYYMQQEDKAIELLSNLLKNPEEESFYVKAITASVISNFLFNEKLYRELIELEPYLVDIRKVGYEESLINAFYFLGVSLFYADNKIKSLFYLKLTQQDSNCKVPSINSKDDIKATKAQSLFRLIPGKYCYIDLYNRSEKTLEAIDKII